MEKNPDGPTWVTVSADQFERLGEAGWIGIVGIANIVKQVKEQVPEADMIVVTF